jgi:hypothetical protein
LDRFALDHGKFCPLLLLTQSSGLAFGTLLLYLRQPRALGFLALRDRFALSTLALNFG